MFTKASEVKIEGLAKILLYGQSGSGKTYAGAKCKDVAHIVWERQAMATILSINPNAMVYVVNDDGKRTPDEQVERVQDVIKYLRENKDLGIRTVVLDSLNEALEVIMQVEIVKDGKDMPTLQIWGKVNERMKKLIKSFRDLNYNIVFISLAKDDIIENEGLFIKPALSPAIQIFMVKCVNVIAYIYTQEAQDGTIRRHCKTEASSGCLCKRHQSLDKIEAPEIDSWIDKINTWISLTGNVEEAEKMQEEKNSEEAKKPIQETESKPNRRRLRR